MKETLTKCSEITRYVHGVVDKVGKLYDEEAYAYISSVGTIGEIFS